MSFTITITKHWAEKVKTKEWVKVGEEPDPKYGDDAKKGVYGYGPETEKVVEKSCEILKQVVTELDLAAVIKAINKME